MTAPPLTLNDGSSLPAVGLGTYPMLGQEAERAVATALEEGYRLLDTASFYGNEAAVGRGLRLSGVPRDEVTLVSKLRGSDHAFDAALAAGRASARALGVDRLDLYLIHWPNPSRGLFVDAWRALVRLRDEGIVRSIGVSNFEADHLERVVDATGVVPAVNQIELHPEFTQLGLRTVHDALGIRTMAWSPLGRGHLALDTGAVAAAADAHGVSIHQVVLRWHFQQRVIPIPKSASAARQRQNLDLDGFVLDEHEMAGISARDRVEGRTGAAPNEYVEL